MRILHTSDWHFGKSLCGHRRHEEHVAFANELVELASECDLVMVSGDVFDTYNPPIDAEELLFDTLARLGDGGRRAVVVIAGNHDSPDRLTAARPLALRHGVFLLGRPGEVACAAPRAAGRVSVLRSGPSFLELGLVSGERTVVAALPYPSEARLRTRLSASVDERSMAAAYSSHIAESFASLATQFDPTAVNVATSHLHMQTAYESESERKLVGGAYQVDPSALPGAAQYVGLGHMHCPQEVAGATTRARYGGAPLAFRMSERTNPRVHTLIDVSPGAEASVELVPVSAGRALAIWEEDSVQQVVARVERGDDTNAYIELRLALGAPLNSAEHRQLARLPRDFIRTRVELPMPGTTTVNKLPRRLLPPAELFRAYVRETAEHEPEQDLVDLFVELASQVGVHPAAAGSMTA
jgi:DNA repair protein SbcD/Mre11